MRQGILYKTGRLNDKPNPHAFRTESMEGTFAVIPRVNGYFQLTGESLTPGCNFRIMTTSIIAKVHDPVPLEDGTVQLDFETQNSLYRLVYVP